MRQVSRATLGLYRGVQLRGYAGVAESGGASRRGGTGSL
jgi:hypothetical protein